MKKFLSIIIPRYKESEMEIFPLLSSIRNQIGIDLSDIEIIVSNDGGNNELLNTDFLSLFGMDIKQITLSENRGTGVVRQAGLDVACGQYVMFCDADDMLHNVGVLNTLIQEAEKNVPDIISSFWIEEMVDMNNHFYYITHEIENTWMHGKLLRRQYLVQNNIRFHNELRVHEDSYFLSIASSLTDKKIHVPIISYVWKYNSNSITRNNNGIYTYNSFPEFIKACIMSFEKVNNTIPKNVMEYKVVQFIIYNYFTLHSSNWKSKEDGKYIRESEEVFVKHIVPFWHYFKNANEQTINAIYNEERQKSFTGNIEDETLWNWIKRLEIDSNRE